MLTAVIGRRGRGKTTLGWFLVSHFAQARIVIDPRGLFRGVDGDRVRTVAEVDAAMRTLIANGRGTVIVTAADDIAECFTRVCQWLRVFIEHHPTVKVGLLVDELRFLPTDDAAFDWLARCAPQDECSIVMTCHRPVDVPTTFRSILDYWCIFHVTLPNDLDVLADTCGPDVARRAEKLGAHDYIEWNDGKGVARMDTDPKRWHLSLTPAPSAARVERKTSDRIFG